ncbi:MAG TPA: dienelactone hydrolase family protein [Candidatus Tyrphobacter sp.]
MNAQTRSIISEERIRLAGAAEDLGATLCVPLDAAGLVIFAHGSGSSRFSPRNRLVADRLGEAGYATLLTDLLTQREERVDRFTAEFRFDIPRLAQRLIVATEQLRERFAGKPLPIGYFGASTGAAAALIAAAERPQWISAVVSRGGRPDLAGDALGNVSAPTLLIVGGNDTEVIALNRRAQASMRAHTELAIVPGATHLFEEPGALERVADLAAAWFTHYLAGSV